jgi:hypothetical protein
MKRPTNDRQPAVPGKSKVNRATVLRLAFGVALAGFSVALLIAPATGLGAGNLRDSLAQNAKTSRTMNFAPVPVATLTVAIADASPVVEGNPPASPTPTVSPTPVATFVVSLSAPNSDPSPVTVDFQTQDGSASQGSDYQNTFGTISFAQTEQTKTITVPVIPDTQPEGDENFSVKLSNPIGIGIATGQDTGTATIVDDDPGGVIQFSSATYNVNEGSGSATITVTRTVDLIGTVTVNFQTSDGTANQGQDYGHTAGTLTFGPGVTSQTFQVPIIDDTIAEPPETVSLQLSGATNGATLGSQQSAVLQINDNDATSDIFAVTINNNLLRFKSDAPVATTFIGPITGLQSSEQVVAIDVRPTNGQLYALGNLGGTGRLYTINPTTAAATPVAVLAADPSDATSPYTALSGTAFDIDFDPVADRLRVVSDADQNFRVNPANGQVITDNNLGYGASDPNFGANPNIVAAAYSNSFAGATSTTLFDIDSNLDVLAQQDPPNNGLLRTFGQMSDPSNGFVIVNTTEVTGLDIRGSDNAIFASFTAVGDSASKLALIVPGCFGCRSAATTIGTIGGGVPIRDIAIAPAGTFQFTATTATAAENAGKVTLTVTRTGDTTGTASVECDTADGTATQKGDYTIARTRLTFGPGDTSKTCDIFIVDDSLHEANETFTVSLFNPTGNFTPGTNNTVTVTITDNDSVTGINPIDTSTFFVRQHYLDFLGREPDATGLAFWTNNIESCGTNLGCRDAKRVDTSAAFFLSIEFQETGFYVLCVQAAGFNKQSDDPSSRLSYANFMRDARQVGEGVVIGQPGALAQLDQNKNAYALQIVSSPAFIQSNSTSIAGDYADGLFRRALRFNGSPTTQERQNAIDAFGIGDLTGRAAALRSVADSASVRQKQLNSAFVLMEYFGYLRRNPTDAPDTDNSGYSFWLAKLNDFDGDFRKAEMVQAFIRSDEYRQRFGP